MGKQGCRGRLDKRAQRGAAARLDAFGSAALLKGVAHVRSKKVWGKPPCGTDFSVGEVLRRGQARRGRGTCQD